MSSQQHTLRQLAERSLADGDVHGAASALDCAFGLNPNEPDISAMRKKLLDQLAVIEHGITFRYIPSGSFLMGSGTGEDDERPIHQVQLNYYWLSETPIAWGLFCRLMDWEAPPRGFPKNLPPPTGKTDMSRFRLMNLNKIRLQYCEDETTRAIDWHAHAEEQTWTQKGGAGVSSKALFGLPPRANSERAWSYEGKPMVCVSWEEAEALCARLNQSQSAKPANRFLGAIFGRSANIPPQYRLPSEAEWEKGARGGLIGCRYPWGDDLPVNGNCDFNRFNQFSILPSKRFPPNSYGLYAMSGGVWEWTSDWYDAEGYGADAAINPRGTAEGKQKLVRGGSWADCPEAVTVSFRMSMGENEPPPRGNPNVGFRLCRVSS